MKFKKLESGRSMVEMLGVLAIIGVLSIGGIAGYSLSMRRHRANDVVYFATRYALVAYGQCQQKILNGETDTLEGCSRSDTLDTTNADIGPLPAGINRLYGIRFDNQSSNGIDTISFSIHFDDDKLCQAVGAVTGHECYDNVKDYVRFRVEQH